LGVGNSYNAARKQKKPAPKRREGLASRSKQSAHIREKEGIFMPVNPKGERNFNANRSIAKKAAILKSFSFFFSFAGGRGRKSVFQIHE
jgi:hypothetical protein